MLKTDSQTIQMSHKSEKLQLLHDLSTRRHCQFFFDIAVFPFLSLVTGPSFMSTPLLVLEINDNLWQFFV